MSTMELRYSFNLLNFFIICITKKSILADFQSCLILESRTLYLTNFDPTFCRYTVDHHSVGPRVVWISQKFKIIYFQWVARNFSIS